MSESKSDMEKLREKIDGFFAMDAVQLMTDCGFFPNGEPTMDDLIECEEIMGYLEGLENG